MTEKTLTTAELVGWKAAREIDDPELLRALFRRAGYEPGSPEWDQAMRGAHLAYTLLISNRQSEVTDGRN